jgi:hypothetical protein
VVSGTPKAESAAEVLRAEGYAVEIQWSVDAILSSTTHQDLDSLRSRMRSLAERYGGRFLGNGTFGPADNPRLGD